jgi:hypothetical protein
MSRAHGHLCLVRSWPVGGTRPSLRPVRVECKGSTSPTGLGCFIAELVSWLGTNLFRY